MIIALYRRKKISKVILAPLTVGPRKRYFEDSAFFSIKKLQEFVQILSATFVHADATK